LREKEKKSQNLRVLALGIAQSLVFLTFMILQIYVIVKQRKVVDSYYLKLATKNHLLQENPSKLFLNN